MWPEVGAGYHSHSGIFLRMCEDVCWCQNRQELIKRCKQNKKAQFSLKAKDTETFPHQEGDTEEEITWPPLPVPLAGHAGPRTPESSRDVQLPLKLAHGRGHVRHRETVWMS